MHWAVGLMGYQANDRDTSTSLLCMNYLTQSTPKIFLVLLEILGFIVSC